MKDLVHKIKKIHFFIAIVLYVLGKIQLFTGADMYMAIDPEEKVSSIIIYQVIVIALVKVVPDLVFRMTRKSIGIVKQPTPPPIIDVYG